VTRIEPVRIVPGSYVKDRPIFDVAFSARVKAATKVAPEVTLDRIELEQGRARGDSVVLEEGSLPRAPASPTASGTPHG
jgi:hypothetical protein